MYTFCSSFFMRSPLTSGCCGSLEHGRAAPGRPGTAKEGIYINTLNYRVVSQMAGCYYLFVPLDLGMGEQVCSSA